MVITDVSQVTSGWLTRVLKSTRNPVSTITVTRSGKSNVSTVHYLTITYDRLDASLPAHLFLKLVKVSSPEFFGRELAFYNEVAPVVLDRHPAFTVLRCFAAAYDPDAGHAHLLFEDVSLTHFSVQDGQPTENHYAQAIDGFAMLHATWWQHPRLGVDVGQMPDAALIGDTLQRAARNYAALSAQHRDLDPRWRSAFSRVVTRWPDLRRTQMLSGAEMTVVHRDPHTRNFLYPRSASSDLHAIIIDWDAWRIDHGTVDLAYMMAFHWPEDRRAALEMSLLRRYHRRLERYGVGGYTWEQCLLDYRASIVRCLLFMLVAWRKSRKPGDVWWNIVGRGVRAYHDFNCTSLY